jgi:hypothetical protein
MQRSFAAEAAQEKDSVTRGPLRFAGSLKEEGGGMQEATVNASTSLRTKKRGKVPPRLETLESHQQEGDWERRRGNLRSKQSHIRASNNRIRDPGMES